LAALRRPPREVAQALLAELDLSDLCGAGGIEVAGPGFINLTLNNEALSASLSELLSDRNSACRSPKCVMSA